MFQVVICGSEEAQFSSDQMLPENDNKEPDPIFCTDSETYDAFAGESYSSQCSTGNNASTVDEKIKIETVYCKSHTEQPAEMYLDEKMEIKQDPMKQEAESLETLLSLICTEDMEVDEKVKIETVYCEEITEQPAEMRLDEKMEIKQDPMKQEPQSLETLLSLIGPEDAEVSRTNYSPKEKLGTKSLKKEMSLKEVSNGTSEGMQENPIYFKRESEDNVLVPLINAFSGVSQTQQQSVDGSKQTEKVCSKLSQNMELSGSILSNNEDEYIMPDTTHDKGRGHIQSNCIKEFNTDSCSASERADDSCSDWEEEYLRSSDKYLKKKSNINKKVCKTGVSTNKSNPTKFNVNGKSSLLIKDKISIVGYIPSVSSKKSEGSSKEERDLHHSTVGNVINVNYEKQNQIVMVANKNQSTQITDQNKRTTQNNILMIINKDNIISPFTEIAKKSLKSKKKKKKKKVKVAAEPKVERLKNQEGFNQNLLLCHICNNWFKTKKRLSQHITYSLCSGYRKKGIHQCDICGTVFTSVGKLQDHQNSHNNARPHKCFDCDKQFNSKGARLMHHKKIHQNIKFRHLCCYCGMITQSSKHLVAHEETHRLPEGAEIPTPFKCLQCGRGYISQFALTKHKREHKLKKCSMCSKEFLTDEPLRSHLEDVHKIVTIHKCEICSKTFKSKNKLSDHIKSHSTVLKYFCDICDKGFKRKNHIKQHMITHSDERPISCPECGERYKRNTHLKQHMASCHSAAKKR